ncbi:MAG: type II secretion system protein [Gammaproteobacteria bacterium]|nr:type II secretion system protein [Gammaproteobacteria bacterium]
MKNGQPGFTLLELVIVLFIMALLGSMVMVNFHQNTSNQLRLEATRLGGFLQSVQVYAEIQGATLKVNVGEGGIEVVGFKYKPPLATDFKWLNPDTLGVVDQFPIFSEPLQPLQKIILSSKSDGQTRVVLQKSGVGMWQVGTP